MTEDLDPLTETLQRDLHWVGVFMIAVGILAFLFVGIASFVVEFLVGASFMMVANAIWRSPGTSLAGLAIIAAGVPIYFLVWRQSAVQDS